MTAYRPPLPQGTAEQIARHMLDDRDLDQWTGTAVLDLILRLEELDPPEVQEARRAALLRETLLADQLDDYAELAGQGLSNEQIAERMRVHVKTARRYGRRLAAGDAA